MAKSTWLDPIAYRTEEQGPITENTQNWWFEPDKLKNADVNIGAYGDDSSAANYNNPELWWGQNAKYTWENTKNTSVAYNKDATIAWLNPNYAYWQKAQMVNSWEAWYIQRRNDEIASALFNEGKVTEADVRAFLLNQQWFMDSEANERENTIQSVWKRIGQFQQEQAPKEEKQPINEDALKEDTSWKIYGKDTADTWNPMNWINTLADANSIYTQMQEKRVQNVNSLRSMDPSNAAALAYSWTTPYWEQTMRDVQSLDPQWYAQYKEELKKLYTQDSLDEITHWSAPDKNNTIVTSIDQQIDNDIKNWEESNTNDQTHEWTSMVNTLLRSNQVATSTQQEMLNIKKDLADLNTQLEELPWNAEKLFKWDVPDYLVQAYISNNSQRIQSKIKNLENRYSSLSDMYKTEVSQAQWQAEYNLKLAEHNRALTNDQFDRTYKNQKLMQDSVQWVNWIPYTYDAATRSYVQMDNNTALYMYNWKVQTAIERWQSLIGQKTWLECEWYTDMQAKNTAWVTMVWANWWATNWKEKVLYATWGWFIWHYDENWNPVWDINWEIYYWDADVYDLIPQVWDIAVWVWWAYDSTRWHTMYVDSVRKDENWEWMFHYTATNLWSTPDKYTVWYEWTKSLSEFMANNWIWFWNPYKQAQYDWRSQNNFNYSPMQPAIDKSIVANQWKIGMLEALWEFQEWYTLMYELQKTGQMSALIDEGSIQEFVQQIASDWATQHAWDNIIRKDDGSVITNFFQLPIQDAISWATNYWAQELWDPEAYNWFLSVMRMIQIKLRDESWAAINQWEWSTDFNLYLPKPWDKKETKEQKVHRMEEFVRRMAAKCWIPSSEYIPIFNYWTTERSYE